MKYLILLLLVAACSSAKKDAQKLHEKGQYELAVAKWLEAYKNDPTDEDVINGLKEAQDHVVNDKLVRVRNMRNTKNYLDALKELKSLVEVEAQWNYKLDFNSANFQGQETTILWKYQKERFASHINNKQPLAAAFYYEDYKHVFSHVSSDEQKAELAKIKKSGINECKELREANSSKAFSRSFANQFCRYFLPQKDLTVDYKPILFSKTESKVQTKGLSPEFTEILTLGLQKTFELSPWFYSGSKQTFKMELTGKYDWVSKSELIPQVHSYQVQVPYSAWDRVKRTVVVNGAKSEVYENVRVTKYRNEVRTYPFYGTRKDQKFEVNISGKSQHSSFNFSKEAKEEVIMHNYSIPEIGLVPKTADLAPQINVFKDFMNGINEKFAESLITGWENEFCVMPEKRDSFSISEQALRCRRIKTARALSFTNNWFENNYAVNAEAAVKVLGEF